MHVALHARWERVEPAGGGAGGKGRLKRIGKGLVVNHIADERLGRGGFQD